MKPSPATADASKQVVHGVPINYISDVARAAAAAAHEATKQAKDGVSMAISRKLGLAPPVHAVGDPSNS